MLLRGEEEGFVVGFYVFSSFVSGFVSLFCWVGSADIIWKFFIELFCFGWL